MTQEQKDKLAEFVINTDKRLIDIEQEIQEMWSESYEPCDKENDTEIFCRYIEWKENIFDIGMTAIRESAVNFFKSIKTKE